MSGTRKIIATISLTFLSVLAMQGQEPATVDMPLALQEEGFEDIRLRVVADTLFTSIEDRAHRGTFRGAAAAIQRIAADHPELQHFEVVLTDYKMPQLIVHASRREGSWDVRVDRQMAHAQRLLRDEEVHSPSTGKLDITVFPMLSLVNNKLDHIFDYSVRIAPAFAMTLWTGARLTLQPIFPIAHRVGKTSTQRFVQIGIANVSQQVLSTRRWQVSAAAGFFHPEHLGAAADIQFHALRGLDLSLRGGYTIKANNTRTEGFGLIRGTEGLDFMAKADYYEPHTKLHVELQGGRFLYGDYGGRLDVTRHFGEYAIGVYGIRTEGINNAGFHFAIPLGGKRQKRTKYIRLRLPEYFGMEYSMISGASKYWEQKMGETYATRPDQNRSAHFWEPAFVEEYVSRLLNATFE